MFETKNEVAVNSSSNEQIEQAGRHEASRKSDGGLPKAGGEAGFVQNAHERNQHKLNRVMVGK
jgi:hypothetical protein